MIKVAVSDQQSCLTGRRREVRRAVELVLKSAGLREAAVSVALVDDPRIRELNRQFLGHDYPTDVISFNLTDEGEPLSGEVVASAERAVAEAAKRRGDAGGELLLYVVHGTLHLLGYDDAKPVDFRRMHAREDELMAELGYPGIFGGKKRQ